MRGLPFRQRGKMAQMLRHRYRFFFAAFFPADFLTLADFLTEAGFFAATDFFALDLAGAAFFAVLAGAGFFGVVFAAPELFFAGVDFTVAADFAAAADFTGAAVATGFEGGDVTGFAS